MKLKMAAWVVGVVVGAVALAELPCLALALVLSEPALPFAVSMLSGLAVMAALFLLARREREALDHRSAFLVVTLGWVSACLVGALPFIYHPDVSVSVVDAVFESTSGFTTTGATVFSGLDTMPRSVLLWRALTHWLGGMGIVLLGVAVLPVLGVGGMQLFKAESTGPTKDKLTPRVVETAKVLWLLYLGLTVASTALLYASGMPLFDAICHALAALSTGGFSTHDASLGHYDSGLIHTVTSISMLLGGASFLVLYRALTAGIRWNESPELRAYIGIFACVALLIGIDLRLQMPEQFQTLTEAANHAIFQAASILTTTGFVTRDFAAWPHLSQSLLLLLCFVGGMAGSTAGGVKVVRVVLFAKLSFVQFFRIIHPRGVATIKLGTKTVEDDVLLGILGFIAMWMLLLAAGTALLAMFGSDLVTAGSAAAVTLGNIGPGFGEAGPSHTFEPFSTPAKIVMSLLMILGRLEVFAVLVVLTPSFWRQ
jgi:trk system potassium uptake protein TrkH